MRRRLSLAGVPGREAGRYYPEEQVEARMFTGKHAFRTARKLVRECIQQK